MKQHYYAVHRPYGNGSRNTWEGGTGGNQADTLCVYHTAAERDAACQRDPEHMQPIRSNDRNLRRFLAQNPDYIKQVETER